MKLIKAYTEILTPINGEQILKDIEKVARTCYKSEDKITEDDSSARDMVSKLIKRGHEAMLEFSDITVKFVCDRGVSHEIVRHRVASYAQESTRYCNYNTDKFDNEITFILPCWIDENEIKPLVELANINNKEVYKMGHDENIDIHTRGLCSFIYDLSNAEHGYNFQVKSGWSPQQARSILSTALKTEINVKMNIREWRHFFRMRCSNAAHPQMQELTRPLLKQFQSLIPILFDDITY